MLFLIPKKTGYTLIELLVVISIASLLFFFALAAYQSFNRSQALQTGAMEVKAVVRDAQNRAISGERLKGGLCTGREFLGWKFVWQNPATSYDYRIFGECYDPDNPPFFGEKQFYLPTTDNISFTNSGTIRFNPLNRGANLSAAPKDVVDNSRAAICIKGESSSATFYKITVSSGGDINVAKTTTCP